MQNIKTSNDYFLKFNWFPKKTKPAVKKCNLKKTILFLHLVHTKTTIFWSKKVNLYKAKEFLFLASIKKEKGILYKPKISTITRFAKTIISDKIKPSRNKILVNNEKFAFSCNGVS